MRPWRKRDVRELARIRGIFTDIDDTLTTGGVITDEAMTALESLRAAAIPVIAVTGRPMGWSRQIAKSIPVEAVVAENGAVVLVADEAAPEGVRIEYVDDKATRDANAIRLRAVAERIVREVPEAKVSHDSPGRVTDIAIDHHEYAHLSDADIARVVSLMREAGMTATVSSIHINGWFGSNTKLTGAQWAVERLFGRDLDAERNAWLYVGDSTNDEMMFAAFPLSVGVANLMDFADQLMVWPAYVTEQARGRGFMQVAAALLEARATA